MIVANFFPPNDLMTINNSHYIYYTDNKLILKALNE